MNLTDTNTLIGFPLGTLQKNWAAIVDEYNDEDEIFLPVVVAWVLFFVTYWTYGLLLLVVERTHTPEYLDKKFQPERPMNFEKTSYNPSFTDLVKNVMFNWVFIIFPALYFMQKVLRPIGLGIYVSRDLPSITEIVVHMLLAGPIGDFLFFHSHYMLHLPWFYQRVHKKHHEFKAPYGLASIYAHWFEALVGNCFAVMGVAFILRIHCLEWFYAGVVGWIGTNTGHSGLSLPWGTKHLSSLTNQFGTFGFTDFHDFHHKYFKGNYGYGIFCDSFYGTDQKWKQQCEKTDLMSKTKVE